MSKFQFKCSVCGKVEDGIWVDRGSPPVCEEHNPYYVRERELATARATIAELQRVNHRRLCGCEESEDVLGCASGCACRCHELRATIDRLESEVAALKGELRADPNDARNLLRVNREYAERCEAETKEARALATKQAEEVKHLEYQIEVLGKTVGQQAEEIERLKARAARWKSSAKFNRDWYTQMAKENDRRSQVIGGVNIWIRERDPDWMYPNDQSIPPKLTEMFAASAAEIRDLVAALEIIGRDDYPHPCRHERVCPVEHPCHSEHARAVLARHSTEKGGGT